MLTRNGDLPSRDAGGSLFWGTDACVSSPGGMEGQENELLPLFSAATSAAGASSLPTWLHGQQFAGAQPLSCPILLRSHCSAPAPPPLPFSPFSPPLSYPPLPWGRSARWGAPRRMRSPPGGTWRWPPWPGPGRPRPSSSCKLSRGERRWRRQEKEKYRQSQC